MSLDFVFFRKTKLEHWRKLLLLKLLLCFLFVFLFVCSFVLVTEIYFSLQFHENVSFGVATEFLSSKRIKKNNYSLGGHIALVLFIETKHILSLYFSRKEPEKFDQNFFFAKIVFLQVHKVITTKRVTKLCKKPK